MRLVFAGTPQVSLTALEALAASPHEIVAVMTRPDAPAGRGRAVAASPIARWATEHDVRLLQPAHLDEPEFLAELTGLEVDACPVVAYGALIPPAALKVPRLGWINLHFSLLPAWRGAAPVQRALMAGDEFTGASTFQIEKGLDTGPVFGTLSTRIGSRETAGDLLARLAREGAELLVATMDGLASGALAPVAQSAEGVSHAPKVSVDEARIRWDLPAHLVDRQIRGCTPAPGAWCLDRGNRLKVLAPQAVLSGTEPPPEIAALTPGELLVQKNRVLVATGLGAVVLGRVQPAGKAAMDAVDWARGARWGASAVLS